MILYNGGVAFILRDSAAGDFETLWKIDQSCFAAGIAYSRAELRFYMRRPAAFTLVAARAEDAGDQAADIAGFIVAEAGPRARGHIITIDVVTVARLFGVGTLLLRGAEDRLLTLSCRAVELETAVDNTAALAFYERKGYRMIRRLPRYYANGVDALVLEKVLA